MKVDEILSRLDGVKREREDQWAAKCPSHADGKPSLAVKRQGDKVLLFCHAGCKTDDVLDAMQLKAQDLFPEREDKQQARPEIVNAYPYRDEDGALLFECLRMIPKSFRQRRPDGAGGWIWNLEGVRRVLYRLPELLAADVAKPVFVVEGEKDADRLTQMGMVATTSPQGTKSWDKVAELAQRVLAGRHVVVLPDNDEPGKAYGRDVLKTLRGVAKSIRVLELPGLPDKGDVSDWALQGGTADQLLALARAVPDMRSVRPELAGIDIAPISQRLSGERAERLAESKRLIPFQVSFLDDLMGGLLPHDLVVLTARAGAGKTQLASTIAENAARAGRRPLMFALEAERREIERRMKYRLIARELWPDFERRIQARREQVPTLSYGAWCRGEFDEAFGPHEHIVDRHLVEQLGDRLQTVYRGKGFTLDDTERVMLAMQDEVDLFIVDHLHYLDTPDEDRENEAVTAIMEKLRDLALRMGKPVLLVAHLRKEDSFRAGLVPRLADLHGSSNVTKIATGVVALAPAPLDGSKAKWNLAPTFMTVLKDRRDGAVPLVAQVVFDKAAGAYRDFYELGRIVRGKQGDEWQKVDHLPYWAKGAQRQGSWT